MRRVFLPSWANKRHSFLKRPEAGTFQQLDPAARADRASGPAGLELIVTDLALLLNGIDLATARRRKRYTHSGS